MAFYERGLCPAVDAALLTGVGAVRCHVGRVLGVCGLWHCYRQRCLTSGAICSIRQILKQKKNELIILFQSELSGILSAESDRLIHPLGGGESALRVCAALLGAGPQASPMHPHHLPGMVFSTLSLAP